MVNKNSQTNNDFCCKNCFCVHGFLSILLFLILKYNYASCLWILQYHSSQLLARDKKMFKSSTCMKIQENRFTAWFAMDLVDSEMLLNYNFITLQQEGTYRILLDLLIEEQSKSLCWIIKAQNNLFHQYNCINRPTSRTNPRFNLTRTLN